jgi:hypothetical protein
LGEETFPEDLLVLLDVSGGGVRCAAFAVGCSVPGCKAEFNRGWLFVLGWHDAVEVLVIGKVVDKNIKEEGTMVSYCCPDRVC